MTYPERKAALARAMMAHSTNHPRVYAHDGLLAYSGTCTDSARLKGFVYIHRYTDSQTPILLAQEAIDGRHVALFDVSE
jgi:hypothetical protein